MNNPIPSLKLHNIESLCHHNPPEWLIEGAVAKGHVGCLYSAPGLGKTFLVLDLVAACLTKGEWAGRRCENPQRVILFMGEGGTFTQARLLAALKNHGVAPETFERSIALYDQVPEFTTEFIETTLKGPVEEWKGALVVIDNLGIAGMGCDLSNDTKSRRLMQNIRRFAAAFEATVILVHHEPKYGEGEQKSEYDSVYILANLDFSFRVWKSNGCLQIAQGKARDSSGLLSASFEIKEKEITCDSHGRSFVWPSGVVNWIGAFETPGIELAARDAVQAMVHAGKIPPDRITSGVFKAMAKHQDIRSELEPKHSPHMIDSLARLASKAVLGLLESLEDKGILEALPKVNGGTAKF